MIGSLRRHSHQFEIIVGPSQAFVRFLCVYLCLVLATELPHYLAVVLKDGEIVGSDYKPTMSARVGADTVAGSHRMPCQHIFYSCHVPAWPLGSALV